MDALDIFTGVMAVVAVVVSLLYPIDRCSNNDRNGNGSDADPR